MKKTNQAFLVIAVLVLVVIGLVYIVFKNNKTTQTTIMPPEVFHSANFSLDARFFANQLIVLNRDNVLGFYDVESQKMTPYNFPSGLFDNIHHFSFSTDKSKAFIIGSKNENSIQIVRYGLIDFSNHQLTWFDEQVLTGAVGEGYRINDITMDSGGNEFLFTLVPENVTNDGVEQYRLVAINPLTQGVREVQTLSGDNIVMQYYNSTDRLVAYNKDMPEGEVGIVAQLGSSNEQTVRRIESLSIFTDDVVYGSYSKENKLNFASIDQPNDVRLTLSPDANYPLLSPSVARSVTGTYTAYHLWKPVTREGVVRVMRTGQEIVVEQQVKGSVDFFFSPDEKKLLVVTEQNGAEGVVDRQGYMLDLATAKSTKFAIPGSLSSIIEWY